jgi:hypothetical protein
MLLDVLLKIFEGYPNIWFTTMEQVAYLWIGLEGVWV